MLKAQTMLAQHRLQHWPAFFALCALLGLAPGAVAGGPRPALRTHPELRAVLERAARERPSRLASPEVAAALRFVEAYGAANDQRRLRPHNRRRLGALLPKMAAELVALVIDGQPPSLVEVNRLINRSSAVQRPPIDAAGVFDPFDPALALSPDLTRREWFRMLRAFRSTHLPGQARPAPAPALEAQPSLRYIARLSKTMLEAPVGVDFSWVQTRMARRGRRLAEAWELNPKTVEELAAAYPEYVVSWRGLQRGRATFDLLRALYYAPSGQAPGRTLLEQPGLVKELVSAFDSPASAFGSLPALYERLMAEARNAPPFGGEGQVGHNYQRYGLASMSLLIAKLARQGYRGLGGAERELFAARDDSRFRQRAYYPHQLVPRATLDKLAATPQLSAVMRRRIARLGGKRPLAPNYCLIVNHQYSDSMAFMELLIAAGLQPRRTAFLSTDYLFDTAARRQLTHLGLPEVEAVNETKGDNKLVLHLKQLLDLRRSEGGTGEILVFDDGGKVAELLLRRFRRQAHLFKVVEVTLTGLRTVRRVQEELGLARLPFVYATMADIALKRNMTSPHISRTIVGRTMTHLQRNGLPAPRRALVWGGGGAMGLPAAIALRQRGVAVTIVEKEPGCAGDRAARAAGFEAIVYQGDAPALKRAAASHDLVLGMTGYPIVHGGNINAFKAGTVFVQGSSRDLEFDMDSIMAVSSRRSFLRARDERAVVPSVSYWLRSGKTMHFLAMGNTINHDGSYHGTGFKTISLELSTLFETGLLAARTKGEQAGPVYRLAAGTQAELLQDAGIAP